MLQARFSHACVCLNGVTATTNRNMNTSLAQQAGILIPAKSKMSKGLKYVLWTIGIPILAVGLLLLTCGKVPLDGTPQAIAVTAAFGIALLPIAVNIAFGPAIISHFRRGKSRKIILVLNIIIVLAMFALQAAGLPGPLLWWWAMRGARCSS
jgi:hypothetical protein